MQLTKPKTRERQFHVSQVLHSTFISNFNKQTESFRRLQSQALRNDSTKFFGAGTGIYLKGLTREVKITKTVTLIYFSM